jgi:hypothetical protein
MPTPSKDAIPTRRKTAAPKPGSTPTGAMDAVDLLMKDHREVEAWFEQFEKTESDTKKKTLADKICLALKVHTQIEEEIFYPACRQAGLDEDKLDEAQVEHDAAKNLIAEIEEMEPGDDLYDAKVKVLGEVITHHVEEEEEEEGLFAQARKSEDIDLNAMAAEISERKEALMAEAQ